MTQETYDFLTEILSSFDYILIFEEELHQSDREDLLNAFDYAYYNQNESRTTDFYSWVDGYLTALGFI